MTDLAVKAVVIGASAGGVEALSALLPRVPLDANVAVMVVLHIPRERPSLLVEIFEHRCALAVKEAEDKEPVVPGTIYFAPPDYHLLVDRDVDGSPILALSSDEPVNYSRPSIDVLFESAADVYRRGLLGVVLTGGNEDGAGGLAAVYQAGGVTVVQDPSNASNPMMPSSALARVPAARPLPLPGIARLLESLGATR